MATKHSSSLFFKIIYVISIITGFLPLAIISDRSIINSYQFIASIGLLAIITTGWIVYACIYIFLESKNRKIENENEYQTAELKRKQEWETFMHTLNTLKADNAQIKTLKDEKAEIEKQLSEIEEIKEKLKTEEDIQKKVMYFYAISQKHESLTASTIEATINDMNQTYKIIKDNISNKN